MLPREEYIEQAYLFRVLAERMNREMATQDLLVLVKEEVLSTTKLPLAIDFLSSELRHAGGFSTAMARLAHYFTTFQTYVVAEAENERGRFDLQVALKMLGARRCTAPRAPAVKVCSFINSNVCAAIGWVTTKGWRRWPVIRFTTKRGGNGFSSFAGRWASLILPT